MDIDLARRTSNELDHISEVVRSLCNVRTEPGGIEFDTTSIEVARIKEGPEYEGVRVTFIATLARARIPMQIDIGSDGPLRKLSLFSVQVMLTTS